MKTLAFFLSCLTLVLTVTSAAYAVSSSDGATGNRNLLVIAAPAECSNSFEIMRRIYLQVFGQPPDDMKELAAAAERLEKRQTTVRAVVRELALSPEYKHRFVDQQTAEQTVGLLYEKVLARAPLPAEVSVGGQRLRRAGFATLVDDLLGGSEYRDLFGEHGVPSRPLTLTACRFPVTIERQDSLGTNRRVSTILTIHPEGVVDALTTASTIENPPATNRFCVRLALWLFDERGDVIDVITPPATSEPRCVGGKTPQSRERKDEWQGAIAPAALDKVESIAIIHADERRDPSSFSKENMDRAKQIKQRVP